MSAARLRSMKIGDIVGGRYSILGIVDKKAGRHPIFIVWDHERWCPLACKLFRSQARAEREAAFLTSLAHPNIVRCFGPSGPDSILIEFVAGPTLGAYLDLHPEGRASPSAALRIAIHVGAALSYMHANGVIYLDLSPSNVIVASGGRPVLVDFGAARRIGEARPEKTVGTDPYIAPEECLRRDATPQADVFGLGVLLFELLTGELPFPEGTRGDPFPQVSAQPIPVREFRPAAPRKLADLIAACLAPDPAARPALSRLLPALHTHIRAGPRMWPAAFDPEGVTSRPGFGLMPRDGQLRR